MLRLLMLKLKTYCITGWQEKRQLPSEMKPFWSHQGEVTIFNNLLLYDHRIVVPVTLQAQTLDKIHQGYQGIQRCRARAKKAVWWLQISNHIQNMIQSCPECVQHSTPPREPMISSILPEYPWQKVGSDLFYFKGATYLLIVDYYFALSRNNSTTSDSIVRALRSIFQDWESQKY